jgi:hypothetical protein
MHFTRRLPGGMRDAGTLQAQVETYSYYVSDYVRHDAFIYLDLQST